MTQQNPSESLRQVRRMFTDALIVVPEDPDLMTRTNSGGKGKAIDAGVLMLQGALKHPVVNEAQQSEALTLLGLAQLIRGVDHSSFTAALKTLTLAIDCSPEQTLGYLLRGDCVRHRAAAQTDPGKMLKLHRESLADYCRAVELEDSPITRFRSGCGRGKLGEDLLRASMEALKEQRSREAAAEAAALFGTAVTDFTAVLAVQPKNAVALYQRARCHEALGSTNEALDDLARAIDLGEAGRPWQEINWTYYSQSFFLERAQILLSQGQLDEAISVLTRCLDLYPETKFRACELRAAAFAQARRWDEAIADYERLSEAPAHVSGRAVARFQAGHYQQAIMDFTHLLQQSPCWPWAYRVRGLSHLKLEEFSAAAADLTRSVELDAKHQPTWASLVWARYCGGDQRGAINAARHALDTFGEQAAVLDTLGCAYHAEGDHEQAHAALTRAAELGDGESTQHLVEWYGLNP